MDVSTLRKKEVYGCFQQQNQNGFLIKYAACWYDERSTIQLSRFARNPVYCQKILQVVWSCHVKGNYVKELVTVKSFFFSAGVRKVKHNS